MSQHPLPASDLVLRLNGGHRDGERISISTPKCCFRFEDQDQQVDIQAAIFRGQAGAAVCSFGREVLINGDPTTIHWLQSGDRIDFAHSITAIVEELGDLTGDSRFEQKVRFAEQNASLQTAIQSLTACNNQPSQTDLKQSPQGESAKPTAPEPPNEHEMIAFPRNPADSSIASPNPEPEAFVTPVPPTRQDLPSAGESLTDSNAGIAPLHAARPDLADRAETSFQSHETTDTDVASESVGKQFDSLTHSPLADGSSQPTSPTADSASASLEQLRSIGEQIKAELAVERTRPVNEPFTVEQSMPRQAPALQSVADPSGVEQNIAGIISRDSQPEPPQEASQPSVESKFDHEAFVQQTVAETTTESDSIESPEQPSALDSPTDSPHLTDDQESSESVSELLERMKSEGQWNGLPEGDEDVRSPEALEAATPDPEPVAELPAGSDETSVEDYMAQLLNRMRGDSPEPQPIQPSKAKPKNKKTPHPKQQAEHEPFVPPTNPLKPEEFIPQKKAEPLKSLGAMRELANSTTRTAIKHSELNRRKALGTAQIAIGVASFVLSLYYLLFGSDGIGDLQFCVGVVCLLIAGFLAWRFYSTMRHNEKVDAEKKRLSEAKQALAAGIPAEQVVADFQQQQAQSDA